MSKKVGFLNFYLNGGDREGVEELQLEEGSFIKALEDLGVSGYKVSFHFKPQYRSWICSITTERPDTTNNLYILSDFGGTPENALLRCYWFHVEVCNGDPWDGHMTSIKEFSDS